MDWRERDHPRHPDGRFREKGYRSKDTVDWVSLLSEALGRSSGYSSQGPRFAGQEKLEDTLARGKETGKRERMSGGISATVRVATFEMPDGSTRQYMHKQYLAHEGEEEAADQFTASEVAAGLIGMAIGAPVPALMQDPDEPGGVFMELVPGVAPGRPAVARERDSVGGRLIGLLDLLIDNRDRHGMNWLLLGDGTPVGIDHGLTNFESSADKMERRGSWVWNDFTEPYLDRVAGGGGLGDNDWHPDDLAEMERRLKELFETERWQDLAPRGGTSWAPGIEDEIILGRLAAIRAKATGTVRRLT